MHTGDGRIIGIDHALCNFRPRTPSPEFIAQLWNGGLIVEALLILRPKLESLWGDFAEVGFTAQHQNMINNLDKLLMAFKSVTDYATITKSEALTPPKGVQECAKRALEWIADGKAGDGFTPVGRKRASDLGNGHPVSLETLKRMKAYFDRHQVDKKAEGFSLGEKGYPSAGRVAWDAWGGDAGYSWAKSMVSRYIQKGDTPGHEFHGNQWVRGFSEGLIREPASPKDWTHLARHWRREHFAHQRVGTLSLGR
jgi:hypothetical protein